MSLYSGLMGHTLKIPFSSFPFPPSPFPVFIVISQDCGACNLASQPLLETAAMVMCKVSRKEILVYRPIKWVKKVIQIFYFSFQPDVF